MAEAARERRREQIRRAQRAHRQRKQYNIEKLKAEVEQLRGRNSAYEKVFIAFRHEINDLYQLLIPHNMQKSCAVRPTRITIRSPKCDQSDTVSSTTTGSDSKGSNLADSDDQTRGHPFRLDTAQIATDFVLDLERLCLSHHEPTVQDDDFPAVEIDKLLQLSSQLSLEGELTPIEAWQRIKEHPGFVKLNRDGLEQLKVMLLPGIHFYEFGAVIDEQYFYLLLDQHLTSDTTF